MSLLPSWTERAAEERKEEKSKNVCNFRRFIDSRVALHSFDTILFIRFQFQVPSPTARLRSPLAAPRNGKPPSPVSGHSARFPNPSTFHNASISTRVGLIPLDLPVQIDLPRPRRVPARPVRAPNRPKCASKSGGQRGPSQTRGALQTRRRRKGKKAPLTLSPDETCADIFFIVSGHPASRQEEQEGSDSRSHQGRAR